jgi:hypothetical protein
MCVLCACNVHSKKAVVCCKVQTLDCALVFANPNSEHLNSTSRKP